MKVMSPTTYVYLDLYAERWDHGAAGICITAPEKPIHTNPFQKASMQNWWRGLQGNLWAEQIYNYIGRCSIWPGHAHSPSVKLRSPAAKKTGPPLLEKWKHILTVSTQPRPSMFLPCNDPDFAVTKNAKGELVVSFSTELEGLDIYYSWQFYPDYFYPKIMVRLRCPLMPVSCGWLLTGQNKPGGRHE